MLASRLLCCSGNDPANRPGLCAQPCADAGNAGARAGAFAPRSCGPILAILVLFGTLGGLGTVLSVPAASWAQKLPSGIPKLEERLSFLSRPIAAFQKVIDQAQGLTQGGELKAVPVAVQGSGLSYQLLSGNR